ncbi:MAG TPA: hypothetical protein VN719_16120 [Gemmatimonadales bacterium]|nr:hypothetical protein [Gemmatimonadales bacterium]
MAYHPLRAAPDSGVIGLVYLLHFYQSYKHARHYWGWALKVEARNSHHIAGTGGRLPGVVAAAGIGWEIALVMPGDKNKERQMKNRGGAARLCPICRSKEK